MDPKPLFPTAHRAGRPPAPILAFALGVLLLAGAPAAAQEEPPRQGAVWSTMEWRLSAAPAEGNPFDRRARVLFTHEDGSEIATETFWDGEGAYRFRFTPPLAGRWTFETESDLAELDGRSGEVEVAPAPDARGPLVGAGTWFAWRVGEERLEPTLYNVYEIHAERFEELSALPTDPAELERVVTSFLDEVEANGMDAVMVRMYNNWFRFGARADDDHDSVNPDPRSFGVLETVIAMAHERGLGVHMWAWGDRRRRWIPPGGVGSEADLRLQRYIAARLGPLSGWTMSYGFDLNEWVTAEEVRAWERTINGLSGWPHLLTAREVDAGDRLFTLGDAPLPLVSSDARPTLDDEVPYELARQEFAEHGRPVLFERRFYHTRDGWDMETTRRALWQFTVAGGAGGLYGVWRGPPYPEPGQLRTFREFWRRHLELGLEPADDLADAPALANEEGSRAIVYAQDRERIELDLTGAAGPLRAVAVDARSGRYEELELGVLEPGKHVWEAPHASDWALSLRRP